MRIPTLFLSEGKLHQYTTQNDFMKSEPLMKLSETTVFLCSAHSYPLLYTQKSELVFKFSLLGVKVQRWYFGSFVMGTVRLDGSLNWEEIEASEITSNDVF